MNVNNRIISNKSNLIIYIVKLLILIVTTFRAPQNSYGQEVQFKTELFKVLKTNISSLPNPYSFSSYLKDSLLYWLPNGVLKNSEDFSNKNQVYLNLLKINISKYTEGELVKFDTIRLVFQSDIPKLDFKMDCSPFSINDSFFIIELSKNHYILKRNGRNEYSQLYTIPSKDFHFESFESIDQDRFIALSYYNYHPLDDPNPFKAVIINCKTKKIEYSVSKDSILGIGLTHLTHKYSDFRKGTLATCDIFNYRIVFLDSTLNIIDSIVKRTDGWDYSITTDSLPNDPTYAKMLIAELLQKEDSILRIEKIMFLNDTSLMVISKPIGSMKSSYLRSIDVWCKSPNKSWEIVVNKQLIKYGKSFLDTVSRNSYKPNLILSSPTFITDQYVILITPLRLPPAIPMLRGDFIKANEEQPDSEKVYFNIFIYKWILKP